MGGGGGRRGRECIVNDGNYALKCVNFENTITYLLKIFIFSVNQRCLHLVYSAEGCDIPVYNSQACRISCTSPSAKKRCFFIFSTAFKKSVWCQNLKIFIRYKEKKHTNTRKKQEQLKRLFSSDFITINQKLQYANENLCITSPSSSFLTPPFAAVAYAAAAASCFVRVKPNSDSHG